jgi:hypothetical protein
MGKWAQEGSAGQRSQKPNSYYLKTQIWIAVSVYLLVAILKNG